MLQFLLPFDTVQVLDVSDDLLGIDFAYVLSELTAERAAELLPMLHTIVFYELEEPSVTRLLTRFIDARKVSDRPVAVSWMSE
jgi:hypothetical protein